jgi:hypothetical protein
VLNEFVAFIDLGALDPAALSERSRAIITFALCGFANFSSIAIQLAVTGNLAPNQRPTIAKLGIRALIAGSLANLMSARWRDCCCPKPPAHRAGRAQPSRAAPVSEGVANDGPVSPPPGS